MVDREAEKVGPLAERSEPSEGSVSVDGTPSRTLEAMLADGGSIDLVHSEMRHRFHNIVAIAQSLVHQTLRDGVLVEVARDTLSRRLAAMGTVIDTLLQREWKPGSLRDTLCGALAQHCGFHDRIQCDGPDVTIGSDAVLALTLAIHELGTNAIKYGALSMPDGRVDLAWKVIEQEAGPCICIFWAEHDGPPVVAPTRTGFGSRLVCRATERSLGGTTELSYQASGVTWQLVAPLKGLLR